MAANYKPGSIVREVSDIAREAVLALLVLAGAAGLVVDVVAIVCINTVHSADGLGGEIYLIGIVLFLPLQLGAAFVVHRWWQQRKLEKRRPSAELPVDPLPFGQVSPAVLEGVDDAVFAKDRARRVVRWAQWLLGAPAGAMVLARLVHLFGLPGLYFTLTEPLALFLWFPSWCAGVVIGFVALSRYGRWLPLALATLYPLLLRGL